MFTPMVRFGGLAALLLALVPLQPAAAQFSDLNLRYHAGIAVPVGDFGDFFDPGPGFGIDVMRPLGDRLDLVVDLGIDRANKREAYVPPTKRIRYQAGLDVDLLGDTFETVSLLAYAGAGAVTARSRRFWVGEEPPVRNVKVANTSFLGTGGLRLGLTVDPAVTWWISGKFNWSSFPDEDAALISEAGFGALDPFSSATDVVISVGLSLNR